jgi:hypothetical protein
MALLLAATAAEAAIYRCDRDGRPAFTSQAGPGCEPIEVKPPEPSRDEVQRETERWTLKQEEERLRREEADKLRQEQAEKARERQFIDLQREQRRRDAEMRRPRNPAATDSTLEEPY